MQKLLLVAGAALAAVAAVASSGLASSTPGGKIAFSSNRTGSTEIYTMNPDGSGLRQLTATPLSDVWPSWSPDGGSIAWRTRRDGNAEIYVMRADGSGPTRKRQSRSASLSLIWTASACRLRTEPAMRDKNEETRRME